MASFAQQQVQPENAYDANYEYYAELQTPIRRDMDLQRHSVYNTRRNNHEKWVAEGLAETKMDHETSKVRAHLLVNEAWMQEKEHLNHQLHAAKTLVRAVRRNHSIAPDAATPSPKATRARLAAMSPNSAASPSRSCCASPERHAPSCPCLAAPMCRRITPKYRAMALMKGRFDDAKLAMAVDTIRNTYSSDHDMLEDLQYRYGVDGEDAEDVSPQSQLRCVEEKIADVDAKWQGIGNKVKDEMQAPDAFPRVIRNLSIMRIFLEGSQAQQYGCDTSERARRDAYHQNVLDTLSDEGTLFVTPARRR
jgi:hypothetical protein